MIRNTLYMCVAAVGLSVLASCSTQDDPIMPDIPPVEEPEQPERVPMNISTRAEGGVMNSQIEMGLYVQHYTNGSKEDLNATGNYINNVRLSNNNGNWTASNPLYWYDNSSPTDIYAYAPYQANVADCRNMEISLPTDQSDIGQLAAADLLWGCHLAQMPSSGGFSVSLNHRLTRVNVKVKPAQGMNAADLKAEDMRLFINNVRCEAYMDLQTSDLTLKGTPTSICAHNNGDLTFTAIVLPQSVGFVNLIRLEWNGSSYVLQHSTAFEAQRNYDFTITFNPQGTSGLNVGISGWDIDDTDYGGVVG